MSGWLQEKLWEVYHGLFYHERERTYVEGGDILFSLNWSNWKAVIQKRCSRVGLYLSLCLSCDAVSCVTLSVACLTLLFISPCYPQAGTKNIRYLSFPYSHPQPAGRDVRVAEFTGNLHPWLLLFSAKVQMVNSFRLVGQKAKSRISCKYVYDKKKRTQVFY